MSGVRVIIGFVVLLLVVGFAVPVYGVGEEVVFTGDGGFYLNSYMNILGAWSFNVLSMHRQGDYVYFTVEWEGCSDYPYLSVVVFTSDTRGWVDRTGLQAGTYTLKVKYKNDYSIGIAIGFVASKTPDTGGPLVARYDINDIPEFPGIVEVEAPEVVNGFVGKPIEFYIKVSNPGNQTETITIRLDPNVQQYVTLSNTTLALVPGQSYNVKVTVKPFDNPVQFLIKFYVYASVTDQEILYGVLNAPLFLYDGDYPNPPSTYTPHPGENFTPPKRLYDDPAALRAFIGGMFFVILITTFVLARRK